MFLRIRVAIIFIFTHFLHLGFFDISWCAGKERNYSFWFYDVMRRGEQDFDSVCLFWSF